jgi:hypothetical protein
LGFALISVSDYNIDKCEENPGTYQSISDEAVFTKHDSGNNEGKCKKYSPTSTITSIASITMAIRI